MKKETARKEREEAAETARKEREEAAEAARKAQEEAAEAARKAQEEAAETARFAYWADSEMMVTGNNFRNAIRELESLDATGSRPTVSASYEGLYRAKREEINIITEDTDSSWKVGDMTLRYDSGTDTITATAEDLFENWESAVDSSGSFSSGSEYPDEYASGSLEGDFYGKDQAAVTGSFALKEPDVQVRVSSTTITAGSLPVASREILTVPGTRWKGTFGAVKQ